MDKTPRPPLSSCVSTVVRGCLSFAPHKEWHNFLFFDKRHFLYMCVLPNWRHPRISAFNLPSCFHWAANGARSPVRSMCTCTCVFAQTERVMCTGKKNLLNAVLPAKRWLPDCFLFWYHFGEFKATQRTDSCFLCCQSGVRSRVKLLPLTLAEWLELSCTYTICTWPCLTLKFYQLRGKKKSRWTKKKQRAVLWKAC